MNKFTPLISLVNHSVSIRENAEADIEEAAGWYERQCKGLGNDFLDEVILSLETITDNPYLFAEVHRQTRRVMIHYYRIKGNSIVIVAVMHGSRDPNQWRKRK
jgi:plasmid stabilization system protein ParE